MKRPRVIANFAMTVDGKISTRRLTPSLFTSPHDKAELLRIRSLGDAVMVGRKTLEVDTMSLGMPDPSLRRARKKRGQAAYPLRVIISGTGRLDPGLKVFQSEGGPVIVFTARRRAPFQQDGVTFRSLLPFDLAAVLEILRREHDVKTLICEGGPGLFRSLLALDAVDELRLTVAPRIFGGKSAPTLTGLPGPFWDAKKGFRLSAMDVEGDEAFLQFKAKRAARK